MVSPLFNTFSHNRGGNMTPMSFRTVARENVLSKAGLLVMIALIIGSVITAFGDILPPPCPKCSPRTNGQKIWCDMPGLGCCCENNGSD